MPLPPSDDLSLDNPLIAATESDADGKRQTTIQSISIAMRFLRVMAEAGRAQPLAALARDVGTGRSTAHRYLQSLVLEGLAMQSPETGHYDLGPEALGIGIAAMRRVDAVEIAGKHMKMLAENHGLSGGVVIWTDRGPTLVRWYRSAIYAITSLALGDVLPLDNTAVGLVFQAYLPRAKIDVARRAQPDHFREGGGPRPSLDEIRQSRWCELTSHLLPNITGQAAPIFDAQGELVCVLTTVNDLGRITTPGANLLLKDVGQLINRATGGLSAYDQIG